MLKNIVSYKRKILFAAGIFLLGTVAFLLLRVYLPVKKENKAVPSLKNKLSSGRRIKGWKVKAPEFAKAQKLKVDVKVAENRNAKFLKNSASNIRVESAFGGGVEKKIALKRGRFYIIRVPVFVKEGRVRLTLSESYSGRKRNVFSQNTGKWEELNYIIRPEDKFYPDSLFVEGLGTVFYLEDSGVKISAQAQSPEDSYTCRKEVYLGDNGVHDPGEAYDPGFKTDHIFDQNGNFFKACKFFQSCNLNTDPPSCQYDRNWPNKVDEVVKNYLYTTVACDAQTGLELLKTNGHVVFKLLTGFGGVPGCQKKIIELTDAVRSFYPSLSSGEAGQVANELKKSYDLEFRKAVFALDASQLVAGIPDLFVAGPKLLGIIRHPSSFLRAGASLFEVKIGALIRYLHSFNDGARSVALVHGVEAPLYSLAGKFPELEGAEIATRLGPDVGVAYSFESVARLGETYRQAYIEALDKVRRLYGLTIENFRTYIAADTVNYSVLENGGIKEFEELSDGFHVAAAQGSHILVFNPALVFAEDKAVIKQLIEHEATHAVIADHGSALLARLTGDTAYAFGNKWGALEEFITSVTAGVGYDNLITDVDVALEGLTESSSTASSLKEAFGLSSDATSYDLYKRLVNKEIPEALRAIARGDASAYFSVSNKWKSALGVDFHNWFFGVLEKKGGSFRHYWDWLSYAGRKDTASISSPKNVLRSLVPFAEAKFICGTEEEACNSTPTPDYNSVLIKASEITEEATHQQDARVSSDFLVLAMRLASLLDNPHNGEITKEGINKVVNEGWNVQFKNGRRIPNELVGRNSWGSRRPSGITSAPSSTPAPSQLNLSGKVFCGNEQRPVAGAVVDLLKGGWSLRNRISSAATTNDGSFSLHFQAGEDPFGYILTAKKGSAVNINSYQCMMIDKNNFCTTAAQASSLEGYAQCDQNGNCTCTQTPQTSMCRANSAASLPVPLNFNSGNIMFILNQCPQEGGGGQGCAPNSPPLIETRLSQRQANRGENFSGGSLRVKKDEIVEYKIHLANRGGAKHNLEVRFNLRGSGSGAPSSTTADINGDGKINVFDWNLASAHYGENYKNSKGSVFVNALVLSNIIASLRKGRFESLSSESGGWQMIVAPEECYEIRETQSGFICSLFRGGGGRQGMRPGEEKDLLFQIKFSQTAAYNPQAVTETQAYVNPSGCCGSPQPRYCVGEPLKRTPENNWGANFSCANNYCASEIFEFYSGKLNTQVGS